MQTVLFQTVLLTMRATLFLLPVHFSSLIPKVLMFTLAISCLTMANLSWFMDLTLQVAMQYLLFLQHWTSLSPPGSSTAEHGSSSHFILSGAISNCPLLFPYSIFNLGDSSSHVIPFCLFILSMGFSGKNTRVSCHFLLQWTVFCQNFSLWLIHLGWLCMACFIPLFSYTSPIITTMLWSMKGHIRLLWGNCLAFELVFSEESCTFERVFLSPLNLYKLILINFNLKSSIFFLNFFGSFILLGTEWSLF